jgi:trimeric autotransporter adhesin
LNLSSLRRGWLLLISEPNLIRVNRKDVKTPQSKSTGPSPLRIALHLILAALIYFASPQRSQAVLPAPDGGYAGGNTAEGDGALFSLTMGYNNTATGRQALYSDTTGSDNTAIGFQALDTNTIGTNNTAVGEIALARNATGSYNTASGTLALYSNTTGIYNTANGYAALWGNTGSYNTASGSYALSNNTGGSYNTGTGVEALQNNAGGRFNTADGYRALFRNTSDRNTATGAFALSSNISGPFNTADGYGALNRNTTGQQNTAAGYGALSFNNADNNSGFGTFALYFNSNGAGNSAFGWGALGLNSGNNNTALGYGAGANLTAGDNNIDIGNVGVAAESNTIRIGTAGSQTAAYVAGIFGAPVTDGAPVLVNTNGHLGTAVSSVRFKNDIKPMDKSSEAILSLKPVTFRYKTDTKGTPQFGLIAEEVAKVNPDLVVRDEDGKPYTVRYDQVNAMLLNEFLKEHRKVEAQQATIAELKSTVAQQQDRFGHQEAQIQALTSGLQKVSAQLEVRNRAPQTVAARNDR